MKQKLTEKEQEAIKKARNTYMREYYRKNKEKRKAEAERYWLKKAVEYGFI